MTAPSAPAPFVTLDEVKAHLNITSTRHDEELPRFISAVCTLIEKLIGPVTVRTVTDYLTDTDFPLVCSVRPTLELQSVTHILGGYDTTNLHLDPAAGIIIPTGWYALPLLGVVTLTYTAGRPTVTDDIRMAALEFIRHLWQQGQNGVQKPFGQGSDDTTYTAMGYLMPNRVREMLSSEVLPMVAI